MISFLNILCWPGYLIWWGLCVFCLFDYCITEFQMLVILLAGILGVWLLMSRLFKGTSQDEDFELEEDSEVSV